MPIFNPKAQLFSVRKPLKIKNKNPNFKFNAKTVIFLINLFSAKIKFIKIDFKII